MQSYYFLAMLIGVVWLAIWSSLPQPYDGKGWWPFTWSPYDMRQDAQGVEGVPVTEPGYRGMRRRQVAPAVSAQDLAFPVTTPAPEPMDAAPAWRLRVQRASKGLPPRTRSG
jgi:hypothetical protein